jgi:hypothetical protein
MRAPTVAAAAFASLLAAAAAGSGAGAVAPGAMAKACAKGSTAAVIAGKHICLRQGRRCARRYDRQYHRYGFHCHTGRLARSPPPQPRILHMQLVASIPPTGVIGTDLAFWGDLMFAGDFGGFRVVDISSPSEPKVLARVRCAGSEADISVWDGLVFLSVDRPVPSPMCDQGSSQEWEGIRIFDVSNPRAPRYKAGVATACGSHTQTLVPDLDRGRVLIYVSALCPYEYNKLPIVEVPLAEPSRARVLKEQPLRADTLGVSGGRGCHDIGAFPAIGLAAAACGSEGQIWDISDPANPDLLHAIRITNPKFTHWHSATFTWDGKTIAFGDEAYGGHTNVCTSGWGPETGAVWLYRVADAAPLGHFKIPRRATGDCTAHDYNLVPTTGDRSILVSGWFTGGASVADVTDPAAPRELAYAAPANAYVWAAYWYNGFVYAHNIARGIDIYRVSDDIVPGAQRLSHLNPQTQEVVIR